MPFKLKVNTPTYSVIFDNVLSINVLTISGEITILPHHFPLVTGIDNGKIHIKNDNSLLHCFISEGILYVKDDEVVLTVNNFEYRDDIDLARAKASYERALKRINSKNEKIDIKRAQAALSRAIHRIQLVENY